MPTTKNPALWLLACLLLPSLTGCAYQPRVASGSTPAAYDDAPYAEVLRVAVKGEAGLVDYPAINGPTDEALERYLAAVAAFGPKSTPEAFPTRDDQLAYYLNAYNAFMLRKWLSEGARTADIDDKVGWLTWFTTASWKMDGRSITMHTLEQGLIRPRFKEPRIHFALICGALSCPPLLDEPFTGDRLDEQLDELGRRWFAQPDGLRVGSDGRVYLSAILDWYRGDFKSMGGLEGVIERYLDDTDPRKAAALAAVRGGSEKFLPYDWSINLAP